MSKGLLREHWLLVVMVAMIRSCIAFSPSCRKPCLLILRTASFRPRILITVIDSCHHFAPHQRSRRDSSSSTQSSVKSYQLHGSTSNTSKSGVVVSTSTNHTLRTDVPLKMGGKNEAAQPVELLLAALIGCTQATALFVGRQINPQRILIDRMYFDIKADRDERGALTLPIEHDPDVPSRLQRVSGTIVVHAAKQQAISDESMHVLKEQTERRCPVANMILASGCEMDIQWVDGSSQAVVP